MSNGYEGNQAGQIREMAAELLGVPAAGLPTAIPFVELGMNSMRMIMLLTQLENTFRLKFDADDLEGFGSMSLSALVRLVQRKLDAASP